jgi:hypothetical protein
MQSADFPRFRDLMAGMGRVFGSSVDTVILDVYWLVMRDWTLPEFESAAAHLMATAQFMPKPADFTALRKKAGEVSCAEAWTQVCQLVSSGTDAQRQQLSPRILRVVHAMGGWRSLEMAETATRHFRENRFRDLWEELGDADEARTALPSVAAKLTGPTSMAALLNGAR